MKKVEGDSGNKDKVSRDELPIIGKGAPLLYRYLRDVKINYLLNTDFLTSCLLLYLIIEVQD